MSEFHRNARYRDGHLSWCKRCMTKKKQKYDSANPEKVAEQRVRYQQTNKERLTARARAWRERNPDKVKGTRLWRNYRLTLEQYNNMFEQQSGRCQICGTHQSALKKPLFVDHCHSSGAIRGLLCQACNTILGLASDSPQVLANAISYLKREK